VVRHVLAGLSCAGERHFDSQRNKQPSTAYILDQRAVSLVQLSYNVVVHFGGAFDQMLLGEYIQGFKSGGCRQKCAGIAGMKDVHDLLAC
jgi:hypothetical protein